MTATAVLIPIDEGPRPRSGVVVFEVEALHARDCSTGDGGGHYEIDPAVEGAVEDNELWLSVSTDASGVGTAEVASPHLARAEAQSVVIHDNDEAGTRLACFDLEP